MEDTLIEANGMTRKDKIRERYKGVDLTEIQIIHAIPQTKLQEDTREKRVAVYVRVSTDDPRQTSSYELQKNHYQDIVVNHPGWRLTQIYADEGISGTSLKHRDAFLQMIEDSRNGKIDLIITKGVSRFARNVLDCIGYVRQLAALNPPVGVLFETEGIYSLDSNSEVILTIIATLAQEESRNKSEVMNASVEMRFRRGIFLTPPLLGYDQDENGDLVVNEDEAKTIRLIFFMYLYGYTCVQIGEAMTKLERSTKKGSTVWTAGSVLQVLQNERHCGDVLARKTWTPSYLDHKSRKNRQDRNQYHIKGHHESIISRDDFIAVQRLICNAKYGNKGFLPELQVVAEGVLKGFVPVNPRWAGFKEEDYQFACASLNEAEDNLEEELVEVSVKTGDFDLRGYQVARAQFFDTVPKTCISFSNNELYFSAECIKKFNKVQYVELLLHPKDFLLAVRPTIKENRRAIHWAKQENNVCISRNVGGAAFLPTMYRLFGWQTDCKYRVRGIRYAKEDDAILMFDMKETEVFIPNKYKNKGVADFTTKPHGSTHEKICPIAGNKASILAYPLNWTDEFGKGFYLLEQLKKDMAAHTETDWNASQTGTPAHNGSELQVSSSVDIAENIQELLIDLQQEDKNGECMYR